MYLEHLNKVYSLDELGKFEKFLFPLDTSEFVEIRLSSINNKEVYRVVDEFKKENPQIICKKNTQFFVKNIEEIKKIITFKEGYFNINSKICYGLNKRVRDENGELAGGYKNIKKVDTVFFDIEAKTHGEVKGVMRKLLQRYVDSVAEHLTQYNLIHPTLIDSGTGYHLIYKINDKVINKNTKERYKSFINNVLKTMDNEYFTIDVVYDLTRVFGLPGTLNPKRQKIVKVLKIDTEINEDFNLNRYGKLKKRVKNNNVVNVSGDIEDSLEWKILINDPPHGERNNTLIFALKLLFKAKGIVDVTEYENILEEILNDGRIILDPEVGTDGKQYNKGITINWCKRHKEWCIEKGIEINKEVEYINDGSITLQDIERGFNNAV